MEQIKKVMIVGLGALGTAYADLFQKTEGVELKVLVDEERKARYEKEGRILNGEHVNFPYVLPKKPGEEKEPMDYILVATKSGGMYEALDMIEGYMGEETILSSVMNGVIFQEEACKRYGADHVLCTLYFGVGGVKNMNGKIEHVGGPEGNRIFFGSVGNPKDEEQTALVKDLYDRAGTVAIIPEDMLYAYWNKFLLIVAFNQTCALFGYGFEIYRDTEEAKTLAFRLLDEAAPIAEAAGVKNVDKMVADLKERYNNHNGAGIPSIAQDRLMKRRMEVDIFADEIIRKGKELGIPTPYNEMVSLVLNGINKVNGFEN